MWSMSQLAVIPVLYQDLSFLLCHLLKPMRYLSSMSSLAIVRVYYLYNQVQEEDIFSFVFYMIHSQICLHQQVQNFVLNGYWYGV